MVQREEKESRLIKHMLQLFHRLEKNKIKIEDVVAGRFLSGQFPAEVKKDFQELYDLIRFMDEIPGGFFIYYADGNEDLIHANEWMLRMFQCETMEEFREWTGNSFRGIVCSEDLDQVEESIHRQIFEEHQDLDHVEYRIRRKDGTLCWVEDYGRFIREETIGDIFVVFIGNSIRESIQQQMEHKQLLEKANLVVEAKNIFLTNLSHDMRTPLNAIFGFTSLAKASIHEPDTVMEYLDQVEKASRQLLDMVTNVLYVSSLSNAAGPTETECDLCQIVEETYAFLQPQAKEKSVDFTLDCGGVTHRGVYADQEKLKQLFLSLSNNAVTYTDPGGRVTVTLTEKKELPGNYAVYEFVVQDTGIGIGEEFLENMFDPFSREKNSTLSGVHGLGLGLTIVKSIVDLMHGSIDVQSVVDKGSTFTVTLTFRVQEVSEEIAAAEPALRILLVEDNEINREIETELLERMGFEVYPAENGKVALEKIREAAPGDHDLIIMDLQMPVMDGWQAAAAIRKLPDPTLAHIPIIALSANISISDQHRAKESGIDEFLSKPMDFTALLDRIEKITKWRKG